MLQNFKFMRKFFSFILMLAFIFMSGGCAQGYYAINPSKITYSISNVLENVSLNYRYNILMDNKNY